MSYKIHERLCGVPIIVQDLNKSIVILLNPTHDENTRAAELTLECACFSKINTRKNYLMEKAAGFWPCPGEAYEGTYDAFQYLLPRYRDLPIESLQAEIDAREKLIGG